MTFTKSKLESLRQLIIDVCAHLPDNEDGARLHCALDSLLEEYAEAVAAQAERQHKYYTARDEAYRKNKSEKS